MRKIIPQLVSLLICFAAVFVVGYLNLSGSNSAAVAESRKKHVGFSPVEDPEKKDELHSPVFSKTLKISVGGPKGSVKRTDKVDLDLDITNTSTQTFRFLNPECSVIYPDAVSLFISEERGLPVKRVSHMAYELIGPRGTQLAAVFRKHTTSLSPSARARFRCPLVTNPVSQPRFLDWSFLYGSPLSPDSDSPQLRPGRYRISARYRVDKDVIRNALFVHEDLTKKFGPVWMGETDSKEYELTVTP